MIEILWRDADYVAVNKPSGLAVHRTGSRWDEGERFLVQILRDELNRPVWPVHRLDRGTSGVLLLALRREAADPAFALFRERLPAKTYVALCRGWIAPEGLVDRPLKRKDMDRRARPDEEPLEAVTRFRRLARLDLPYPVLDFPSARASLVMLRPKTGRRHQLRRHLSGLGHPVMGDSSHGGGHQNRAFAAWFGERRLMLHALRLVMPHPLGRGTLSVKAPLPASWIELAG